MYVYIHTKSYIDNEVEFIYIYFFLYYLYAENSFLYKPFGK